MISGLLLLKNHGSGQFGSLQDDPFPFYQNGQCSHVLLNQDIGREGKGYSSYSKSLRDQKKMKQKPLLLVLTLHFCGFTAEFET